MTIKLKFSGVEYPVLDDAIVAQVPFIKHHGMPEVKNRIILRGGLQYDEAFLVLPGPPIMTNGVATQLNLSSNVFSVIIGNWETTHWRCANSWKIFCGKQTVFLVRLVDSRYWLCEHPVPAWRAIQVSQAAFGSGKIVGSTVEFNKHFTTTALDQAFRNIIESSIHHTSAGQIIATKGTRVTPPGDGFVAAGRIGDIYVQDKNTLQFAQYLLDHFRGLLVRDYADNKLDIVSWTSGSAATGPFLCTWDAPKPTSGGTHPGPSYDWARGVRVSRIGQAQSRIDAMTSVGPIPASGGLFEQQYEYADTRNILFTTNVGLHLNRNREGAVVQGYQAIPPNGKYDTVIFENKTTTFIRQPVPRPEYHYGPRPQVFLARIASSYGFEEVDPWQADVDAIILHETGQEEAKVHNNGVTRSGDENVICIRPDLFGSGLSEGGGTVYRVIDGRVF